MSFNSNPITFPENEPPLLSDVALACLGVVGGLIAGPMGYRAFLPIIFFVGFSLWGGISYVIFIDGTTLPFYASLILGLVFGVIGAVVSSYFWQAGMAQLGAMAGAAITCAWLPLHDDTIVPNAIWPRYVLVIGFGCICAFAILFVQRLLIIAATSIVGAYAVIVSIAVFVDPLGGFARMVPSILYDEWNSPPIQADWQTYMFFGLFVALCFINFGVQLFYTTQSKRCKYHDPFYRNKKKGGYDALPGKNVLLGSINF
mmetsp:Transcript_8497/g.12955  ORF Transcript_8497/g.12955 Transcript_8497/m.12955 type:complete len:258 (-) Transcript_8497:166-939(-)